MMELSLAAPGAAEGVLCLDAETRSPQDLSACGSTAYFEDPAAELLCVAGKLPGDPFIRPWVRGEPVPAAWVEHIRRGGKVRGWNVLFEYGAIGMADAARQGWPPIGLDQLDCSMAAAAACGLPQGLHDCGAVLDLPVVKDVRGTVLMRTVTHRRNSQQPIDDETMEKLVRYCMQDVAAEIAIAEKLPPLTAPEQQLWLLHARINTAGIPLDVPLVELAQSATVAMGEAMDAEMAEVTGGVVPSTSAVPRLKRFLGERGVAGYEDLDLCVAEADAEAPIAETPNLQKHTMDVLLARDDLDPAARRALEIRRSSGKSATKKFAAMLKRVSRDGRVRNEYQFCGASNTGRWSSRGLQVHNLKRQPKNFDAGPIIADLHAKRPVSLESLGLLARAMIRAPAGQVVVKADFEQVEYRGVCWLAGESDRLDALARGELPYELLAARIRGIPLSEVTPDLRNSLGKPVALGSGYGLGPVGLTNLMARQGREIEEMEAKRAIEVFREAHPAVVRLWSAMESAVRKALEPRFANCWMPFGANRCLAVSYQAPWLLLRLPSNRMVRYYKPMIELREKWGRMVPTITVMRRSKITHQYRREAVYGALLVENATQAMCRDILATALVRLDGAGFNLIGHTHDEAILLCDAGVNRSAEIVEHMTRPISWLPKFPLAVDIKAGVRYS